MIILKKHNKCFNLINPLSWFLLKDYAKTTPSPSGADLKVKPMLEGLRASSQTPPHSPATGIGDE